MGSTLGGKGNRLITMHTPYGDATYIETPEMRRGKTNSHTGDFRKPYMSNMGGTGGGDYLQLGNRLKDRSLMS